MNVKATIDIQDVREGIVLIIHVATMLGRKRKKNIPTHFFIPNSNTNTDIRVFV
jgi:hypothetical protein